MSGILDISNLECIVVNTCPYYDPRPFFSPLFILLDYYPIYVNITLWMLTFYCWEFIFTYIGGCLFIDMILNYAIKYIVKSQPRSPGCGTTYEMPSYATEQIMLLNTLSFCIIILWNRKIQLSKISLMVIVTTLIIVSRVYIGINTKQELIIGGVIGTIEGYIYTFILYYFKSNIRKIIDKSFIKKIGIVDNFSIM
jgi:membrane-associated phospholipid phosphatase